jgi:hypothetical protein
MDKTPLVGENIRDGIRLIRALDSSGFPVEAALWFYVEDSDEWLFLLASSVVDRKGPKEAYAKIQSKLRQLRSRERSFGISLRQVSVLSPRNDLIRLLGTAIHAERGISGIRFRGNTINNTYIEDAYIYRIAKSDF